MSAATWKASSRDLVDASLNMLREASRKDVQAKAETAAEERLITALVGEDAAADTRSKFRRMLRNGEFEQKEIEIAVSEPQADRRSASSTCPACRPAR